MQNKKIKIICFLFSVITTTLMAGYAWGEKHNECRQKPGGALRGNTIAKNDTMVMAKGIDKKLIPVLENDINKEHINPSTLKITSGPKVGNSAFPLSCGKILYEPDPSFEGVDSFNYTVQDNEGKISNQAHVTITVNTPPTAKDDPDIIVKLGGINIIRVLTNDTDSVGDINDSKVMITSPPIPIDVGLLETNPGGIVTYTHKGRIISNFTFKYTLEDEHGETSNEAEVTVTMNTPPTTNDDTASTSLNEEFDINVLENDNDNEQNIDVTKVNITFAPFRGKAELNIDGTIKYTPEKDIPGTDFFKYTVTDYSGETSDEASVTVTVDATPFASEVTKNTTKNQSVDIDILNNDRKNHW